MIAQQFGTVPVCQRTFEVYTAAVLSERFTPKVQPSKQWRDMMTELAALSCEVTPCAGP